MQSTFTPNPLILYRMLGETPPIGSCSGTLPPPQTGTAAPEVMRTAGVDAGEEEGTELEAGDGDCEMEMAS
jgi:hypothetical protein